MTNLYRDFHILEVYTEKHDTNQFIVSSSDSRRPWNDLTTQVLYSSRPNSDPARGARGPAAPAGGFKLLRSNDASKLSGSPTEMILPLRIDAQFAFDKGTATYHVFGQQGKFTIYSAPFQQAGIDGTKQIEVTIGPFYIDVAEKRAPCPFKVENLQWSLLRQEAGGSPTTVATSSDYGDSEMYFFLGPAALRLKGVTNTNVHFYDMVRRTVLPYDQVVGQTWDALKARIISQIVQKLWSTGDKDFSYDAIGDATGRGKSAFLTPQYPDLLLGAMLRGTLQKVKGFGNGQIVQGPMHPPMPAQYVNCFDLAAFVYAAFKSLGQKRNIVGGVHAGNNCDIFDVRCYRVEGWGNVQSGALFGHQDTFSSPTNSPFWPENGRYMAGNPLPAANDPKRTGFFQHCFPLLQESDAPNSTDTVVDICQIPQKPGAPITSPNDGGLILPAGWPPGLQKFLDSRDVGAPPKGVKDLIPVQIGSMILEA